MLRVDVQRAYNKAAKTYTEAATVYHEIGRRLLSRLDYIAFKPQVILDAGCGTGYCTSLLQERYPNAEIIGLDIAEKMLQSAVGVDKVLSNMEHLPLLPESIDMIIANQSIHEMGKTAFPAIFKEFHRVLRPQGVLFFSCLGPDSLKELKAAWAIVDTYTHVHDFPDMHDLGDQLFTQQFLQPVVDLERITVQYADPMQLLGDLKAQGSFITHPRRRSGLMGQDALEYLLRGLNEQRNAAQKIPLTYEVIYGHAWRGEKKSMQAGSEVFIPVEKIKRTKS